jgi:antitoxin CptB
MSDPRDIMIRRLRMRSMRRGIREMDLILSAFATARLAELTDTDLVRYETLLAENDHDLYGWITGTAKSPDEFAQLIDQIAGNSLGQTAQD